MIRRRKEKRGEATSNRAPLRSHSHALPAEHSNDAAALQAKPREGIRLVGYHGEVIGYFDNKEDSRRAARAYYEAHKAEYPPR